MPKSISCVSRKSSTWMDDSDDDDDEEEDEPGRIHLNSLERHVHSASTPEEHNSFNPFVRDRPGFSPFQLYGRRKRGRPPKMGKLIPVTEQEGERPSTLKKARPPGVEVKRYLEELKEFTLDDFQPNGKGRKRSFSCPKTRDFEPFDEQEGQNKNEVGIFDIEEDDQFRPRLFDFVKMNADWQNPIMISDASELPKPTIGRPRIHPAKEKVPGRKRGRPSKPKSEEDLLPKEKRPRGRPRIHPKKEGQPLQKPKMIYSFEKAEGNEEEIKAMIASGMVVVNSTERKLVLKAAPMKRGRPRKHPEKEKVPGRPRGRPRVHPVKVKVPGRKRGRPSKPKVEGEAEKEKKPRGRPKKGMERKPKIIFSFEDKHNLSVEELRKLRMEGVKVVDVKKKRGRKKKENVELIVASGVGQITEEAQKETSGGKDDEESSKAMAESGKVPGKKRGRPRIHPEKIKIPGRKRGRPSKPKVDGEKVTKESKSRGKPSRMGKVTKPKVMFSFEDKHDLSVEELRKLRMDGVKVVDVKKKRGRKKKVLEEPHNVAADHLSVEDKIEIGKSASLQENNANENGEVVKKKRGRPKKKILDDLASLATKCDNESQKDEVIIGMEQASTPNESENGAVIKKKRGRKKKVLIISEGIFLGEKSKENERANNDVVESSAVVKNPSSKD